MPCYPHIMLIGMQRTGKDRLILQDIYNTITFGYSIFHNWLLLSNLDFYPKKDLIVYANLDLDVNYFPNFVRINGMEDIKNAFGPGFFWIHDSDDWFDSRDIWNSKKNKGMMTMINNMAKRRLMGRFSCHRIKSLDVKLRSLMNLKVIPEMKCFGSNRDDFGDWFIEYDIFNEWDKKLGTDYLFDLPSIANAYNTEEEVKELIL